MGHQRTIGRVFVLGRPCAGKSTVRALVNKALKSEAPDLTLVELDDFKKLDQIFGEDTGFSRHVPTPDRGVKVIDPSVWAELDAYVIDESTKSRPPGSCLFVELARHDYLRLFKALPQNATADALIVYVDCSLETACRRNERRRISAPRRYISKEEMSSTFAEDDFAALQLWAGRRLVKVDNDGDESALKERVLPIVLERILPLLRRSEP